MLHPAGDYDLVEPAALVWAHFGWPPSWLPHWTAQLSPQRDYYTTISLPRLLNACLDAGELLAPYCRLRLPLCSYPTGLSGMSAKHSMLTISVPIVPAATGDTASEAAAADGKRALTALALAVAQKLSKESKASRSGLGLFCISNHPICMCTSKPT